MIGYKNSPVVEAVQARKPLIERIQEKEKTKKAEFRANKHVVEMDKDGLEARGTPDIQENLIEIAGRVSIKKGGSQVSSPFSYYLPRRMKAISGYIRLTKLSSLTT